MVMVSKEILIQYADLQEEIKYLRKKIDSLQNEQAKMDDKKQHSSVVGSSKDFPYTKRNIKTEGYVQLTESSAWSLRATINSEIRKLEERYERLLQTTNDLLDFIDSIDDSRMRMIITYRVVENYSWQQVADAMGGGNTEDCVKKAFYRFMDN